MLVGAAGDEGQPPGYADRLAVPEGVSEGGRRMLFKQTHKVSAYTLAAAGGAVDTARAPATSAEAPV